MPSVESLIQVLSSGLLMGAAYALVAVGFTIAFGVMNVVNFAHGHVAMAAMFASFVLNRYLGLDPYLAAVILFPVFFVVGLGLYRLVIAPMLQATHAAQLLTTLGLLIVIENTANLLFGADLRSVHPSYAETSLVIGGVALPWTRLFTAAGSLATIAAVWAFLTRTRLGAELRAAADNRIGAVVVGISISRVFLLAFALSTAIAAFAGAMVVPFFLISPFTGYDLMLKAFIIAIIGGLGSLPGALFGGLLVGLIEAAGGFFLTASLSTAMVFGLLVVTLLLRPDGLFAASRR
jgi:branched-chain amino acid transport system permease protein